MAQQELHVIKLPGRPSEPMDWSQRYPDWSNVTSGIPAEKRQVIARQYSRGGKEAWYALDARPLIRYGEDNVLLGHLPILAEGASRAELMQRMGEANLPPVFKDDPRMEKWLSEHPDQA